MIDRFPMPILILTLGLFAGSAAHALEVANGLSTNGLSTNGLSTNGRDASGVFPVNLHSEAAILQDGSVVLLDR